MSKTESLFYDTPCKIIKSYQDCFCGGLCRISDSLRYWKGAFFFGDFSITISRFLVWWWCVNRACESRWDCRCRVTNVRGGYSWAVLLVLACEVHRDSKIANKYHRLNTNKYHRKNLDYGTEIKLFQNQNFTYVLVLVLQIHRSHLLPWKDPTYQTTTTTTKTHGWGQVQVDLPRWQGTTW